MPSSRGSSLPKGGIGVSCIAGGFFTSWATREAPYCSKPPVMSYRSQRKAIHPISACYPSLLQRWSPGGPGGRYMIPVYHSKEFSIKSCSWFVWNRGLEMHFNFASWMFFQVSASFSHFLSEFSFGGAPWFLENFQDSREDLRVCTVCGVQLWSPRALSLWSMTDSSSPFDLNEYWIIFLYTLICVGRLGRLIRSWVELFHYRFPWI